MNPTSILYSAGVLAAVLSAILLCGRLARMSRLGRLPGAASGRIALLDSLNLDPRRRLILVGCEGRRVLVLTGQQDLVVGWLPDPAS